MENNQNKSAVDLEWERRTLCSDESCIGVIGPDGTCKECGLSFDGPLPEETHPPENKDPSETGREVPAPPDPEASQPQTDPDWENRRLCSDGGCIGVIGPDGRCKECGKPFDEQ